MSKAMWSRTVPCRDVFGNDTRIVVSVYVDFTLRITTPLSGADLTDDQAEQLAQVVTEASRKRFVARQQHWARAEMEAEIEHFDEVRQFDICVVLAVTHWLPAGDSDLREILEYLSGLSLPAPSHTVGVVQPCAEWLCEQYPTLRDIPKCPDFGGDEQAMDAWADEQAARIGARTLPVKPLPADRREFKPYMERLLDHVDPTKVWHVTVDGADDV